MPQPSLMKMRQPPRRSRSWWLRGHAFCAPQWVAIDPGFPPRRRRSWRALQAVAALPATPVRSRLAQGRWQPAGGCGLQAYAPWPAGQTAAPHRACANIRRRTQSVPPRSSPPLSCSKSVPYHFVCACRSLYAERRSCRRRHGATAVRRDITAGPGWRRSDRSADAVVPAGTCSKSRCNAPSFRRALTSHTANVTGGKYRSGFSWLIKLLKAWRSAAVLAVLVYGSAMAAAYGIGPIGCSFMSFNNNSPDTQ